MLHYHRWKIFCFDKWSQSAIISGLRHWWPQGWELSSELVRKELSWESVGLGFKGRTQEGPARMEGCVRRLSQRTGLSEWLGFVLCLTEQHCAQWVVLWQGLWVGLRMAQWLLSNRWGVTDSPRQGLACAQDLEPFVSSARTVSGAGQKHLVWKCVHCWLLFRKNPLSEFIKQLYWSPLPSSSRGDGVARTVPGSFHWIRNWECQVGKMQAFNN